MKVWTNAVGYQLIWLAAVWGATYGYWWLGALALVPFAGWYLSRPQGHIDLALMVLVALAGTAIDSLFAATDLIAYAAAVPSPHAAPVWIVTIWAAFALTLRHSFRFLHGRPVLAALLGIVGAPLAYLGAARGWNAVAFPRGHVEALVALALGWSVALPAMIALAARLERRQPAWQQGSMVHVE